MCDVRKVSRAGFCAWLGRPESPRAARDAEVIEQIREAHRESRQVHGSPRVHRAPRARGVACRENTVARPMRRAGVRAATARRLVARTTDSRHGHAIAGNEPDRRLEPGEVDRVWVGDITYIATGEGSLYLAGVLDLGGRKVVGRATDDHLRSEPVGRALRNALGHRRPTGPAMHHSDRGVQ